MQSHWALNSKTYRLQFFLLSAALIHSWAHEPNLVNTYRHRAHLISMPVPDYEGYLHQKQPTANCMLLAFLCVHCALLSGDRARRAWIWDLTLIAKQRASCFGHSLTSLYFKCLVLRCWGGNKMWAPSPSPLFLYEKKQVKKNMMLQERKMPDIPRRCSETWSWGATEH